MGGRGVEDREGWVGVLGELLLWGFRGRDGVVEGAVGLMMRGLRWWMDGGLRSREGEGWGG